MECGENHIEIILGRNCHMTQEFSGYVFYLILTQKKKYAFAGLFTLQTQKVAQCLTFNKQLLPKYTHVNVIGESLISIGASQL